MKTYKIKFYYNEENEDLFAVFTDKKNPHSMLTAYSKIGQHSEVHLDYIFESREATINEYKGLHEELRSIYTGSWLDVLNSDQPLNLRYEHMYEVLRYIETNSLNLCEEDKLRLLNCVLNPFKFYSSLTANDEDKLRSLMSLGIEQLNSF